MFREFIIDKIVSESTTIKSFYLKRTDHQPLDSYLPGQFVTLRVRPHDTAPELVRNYTLSDSPGKPHFRLTIKREEPGIVSQYLHDVLQEGDHVAVSKPMGGFHLSVNRTSPAVLLSGGVGITPMLSMLEYMTEHQPDRRIFFLHASLNKAVQPMLARLRELTTKEENLYLSIHHSEPTNDEQASVDYDYAGLITAAYLRYVLPKIAMDYYLCGPTGFMETMYGYLRALGVSEQSIYYEFFGEGATLEAQPAKTEAHPGEIIVKFTRSDIEVAWDDQQPSLLDLAESAGLAPAFSCRMGTCSTCEATLQNGSVAYDPEPFVETTEGKILICCSQPMSNLEIAL